MMGKDKIKPLGLGPKKFRALQINPRKDAPDRLAGHMDRAIRRNFSKTGKGKRKSKDLLGRPF